METGDFVHPVDILMEEHRKISRYIVNFASLLENPAEWEAAIRNAIQLINHDFVQHERREAILVEELERLMGGKIGPLEMVEKEHRQLDALRKRFNNALEKLDLTRVKGDDPDVLDLLEKDVDCVFLPSVVDRENPSPGQAHSHHCPLIPAAPHMVRAHVDVEARGARFVTFPFHLGQRQTRRRELRVAAAALGVPLRRVMAAAARGDEALRAFSSGVRRLGEKALQGLGPDRPGIVLVGRPYNTCDPGVCLDLPRKLRKLGAVPIPIDCLPVRAVDITDAHPDMYWRSGQDILGAARIVAEDERLQAIYLTSFYCGPDSFLLSYFRRLIGAKPFLELEVDDHTAEAGMLTRCEAFLDSLRVRMGVAA